MKPHPRIRKTIKWGGLVLTVLLVVVWVGSGWFMLNVWAKPPGQHAIRAQITIGNGMIGVGPWWDARWTTTIEAHPFALESNFDLAGARSVGVWRGQRWVPVWFAALVALPPTCVAWRLDTTARRRARTNLCPKCNYERTGLARDAKCPECGSEGVRE